MSDRKKSTKRPRDRNIHAASTVALATSEETEPIQKGVEAPEATPEEHHIAAVTLGKKGGKARAEKLTPERKREIAKKAAFARWSSKPR